MNTGLSVVSTPLEAILEEGLEDVAREVSNEVVVRYDEAYSFGRSLIVAGVAAAAAGGAKGCVIQPEYPSPYTI